MTPGTYNFPDQTQGTTYNGTAFQVDVDGDPLDLSGVSIIMEMRSSLNQQVLYKSVDSGITVTDAEAGEFRIDSFDVNLSPGTYTYDILFIFTSGVVKIYVKGTMKVISALAR